MSTRFCQPWRLFGQENPEAQVWKQDKSRLG